MKNVLFLFGGKSNEHEISVVSAANVFKNFPTDEYNPIPVYIGRNGHWYQPISKIEEFSQDENEVAKVFTLECTLSKLGSEKFISNEKGEKTAVDLVYPMIHGWQGEDGVLQGMARAYGLPFAGPSMETAFATFDKDVTKLLVERAGVSVAPWKVWMKGAPYPSYDLCAQDLGKVLFIKPSRSGSSVGVSRVTSEENFFPALELAAKEDTKVIIEGAVVGREIEVAVFCPKDDLPLIAEKVGEIKPPTDSFYSYDEKYSDESQTGLVVGTELSADQHTSLVESVKKVVQAVSLVGTARVDFFLKPDGTFVLNEINTVPGNTSISMYPKLFEASGILPKDLIRIILNNAV